MTNELADSLLHARWIIPGEPLGAVLEHHCLVIKANRIIALVPSSEAESRFKTATSVDLSSHVLAPGLVNCHTHAAMALMRGVADDFPLKRWLEEFIWPIEAACIDESFVFDGTRLAATEMLRGGVTCFNDMYFFPDVAARAAEQCGIRACIGLIVIDFPTVWAGDADEYLSKGLAVRDELRGSNLITTAFAPHAPYTVSDEPLRRLGVLAEELDVPIHMHVHETAHEVQSAVEQSGKRPLDRLDELGLLGPRLLAVHATQLSGDEITRLAEKGVHVVHCPESNMKLASGICPVPQLLAQDVNIALGTDGCASNNDLDILGEARSAALLASVSSGSPGALPAAAALHAASAAGARALALDDLGTLAPGKLADCFAVDLNMLETSPMFDIHSHLIYAASRFQVSDVWVDGKRVLEDRRTTQVDMDEVKHKANSWRQRIVAAEQVR